MKQHIDKQQVLDLTDKQAVAIYNILYNANYTVDDLDGIGGAGGGFKDEKVWFNSAFETNITIGKMIDILEEKHLSPIMQEIQGKGFWNVLAGYENGDFKIDIDADELCDALWQAVKEVL